MATVTMTPTELQQRIDDAVARALASPAAAVQQALNNAAARAATSPEAELQIRTEVDRRVNDLTRADVFTHAEQTANRAAIQAVEDANLNSIVEDRLDRVLAPESVTARVNESVADSMSAKVSEQMDLWVKAELEKTVTSTLNARHTQDLQNLAAAEKRSVDNVHGAANTALSNATATAVATLENTTSQLTTRLQTAVTTGRETISEETQSGVQLIDDMQQEFRKVKAEFEHIVDSFKSGSPPAPPSSDFDTSPAKDDFDEHVNQQYNEIIKVGDDVIDEVLQLRDRFQDELRQEGQPIVDRLDASINALRVDLNRHSASFDRRLKDLTSRIMIQEAKSVGASGAPDGGDGGDDDDDPGADRGRRNGSDRSSRRSNGGDNNRRDDHRGIDTYNPDDASVNGALPNADPYQTFQREKFLKYCKTRMDTTEPSSITGFYNMLQSAALEYGLLLRTYDHVVPDRSLCWPNCPATRKRTMSIALFQFLSSPDTLPREFQTAKILFSATSDGYAFLKHLLGYTHPKLKVSDTEPLEKPLWHPTDTVYDVAAALYHWLANEKAESREYTQYDKSNFFLQAFNTDSTVKSALESYVTRVHDAVKKKADLEDELRFPELARTISSHIPTASPSPGFGGTIRRAGASPDNRAGRGNRGNPGNRGDTRRRLVNAQCRGCGRFGHNEDTCNQVAIFVLCADYAKKHPDKTKQLVHAWKQKNQPSTVSRGRPCAIPRRPRFAVNADDLLLSTEILEAIGRCLGFFSKPVDGPVNHR